MKRYLTVGLLVVGLAAVANAAQVNFFLTSPDAINGAIDGVSGATLKVNPIIPTGSHTVQLWMQLDSALFPQGGTSSVFGGQLAVAADSALLNGTTTLSGPSPAAPWSAYTAGAAGNAWGPLTFLSTTAGLASAGTTPAPGGPLFLIGSGTLNATGAGDLFITLPGDQAIGSNGSLAVAGLAFGWNNVSPDIGGLGNGGAQPSMADIDAGYSADAGFVGSSLDSLPVTTGVADLTVLPEPATIALLTLGGLLIRRRK